MLQGIPLPELNSVRLRAVWLWKGWIFSNWFYKRYLPWTQASLLGSYLWITPSSSRTSKIVEEVRTLHPYLSPILYIALDYEPDLRSHLPALESASRLCIGYSGEGILWDGRTQSSTSWDLSYPLFILPSKIRSPSSRTSWLRQGFGSSSGYKIKKEKDIHTIQV